MNSEFLNLSKLPRVFAGVLTAIGLFSLPAFSAVTDSTTLADEDICRAVIRFVEKDRRMPPQLVSAVSVTESGRTIKTESGNRFVPWPWTLNANGKGYFLESKAEAVAKVHQLRAKGINSIDVGCMQVNLRFHGKAFATVEDALDPFLNVSYGASYLTALRSEYRNWLNAVERYHSGTEKFYKIYRTKVYDNWMSERELSSRSENAIEISSREAMKANRLAEIARRRAQTREQIANNSN